MNIDLTKEPLGTGKDGKPVYLQGHLAVATRRVQETVAQVRHAPRCSRSATPTSSRATRAGSAIKTAPSLTYRVGRQVDLRAATRPTSTAWRKTPAPLTDIAGARAARPCSATRITTDHISPAGSIKKDSPAGSYLIEHGVAPADFNSYGARRGNHEVMMRGTFANIRLQERDGAGHRGRRHPAHARRRADADLRRGDALPDGAACRWSSSPARNTAPARRATGPPRARMLLGVKAVIAESFERIHRSNLVGMGVLPLQFKDGMTRKTLSLDGSETLRHRRPRRRPQAAHGRAAARIHRADGSERDDHRSLCRIDTARRGRVLPPRRHPALRAAQPGEKRGIGPSPQPLMGLG